MSYLECSQHDCCHNKGGACCLGGIQVSRAGAQGAVCESYRNNCETGNVAADDPPASSKTEIRCGDDSCCHNEGSCCCAEQVRIAECSCVPCCATRQPE